MGQPFAGRASVLFVGRIGVDMRLGDGVDGTIGQLVDELPNEDGRHCTVKIQIAEILEELFMHFVEELQAAAPISGRKIRHPATNQVLGEKDDASIRII